MQIVIHFFLLVNESDPGLSLLSTVWGNQVSPDTIFHDVPLSVSPTRGRVVLGRRPKLSVSELGKCTPKSKRSKVQVINQDQGCRGQTGPGNCGSVCPVETNDAASTREVPGARMEMKPLRPYTSTKRSFTAFFKLRNVTVLGRIHLLSYSHPT